MRFFVVILAVLASAVFAAEPLCTADGVVGVCITKELCAKHEGTQTAGICTGTKNTCCTRPFCGGNHVGVCMKKAECPEGVVFDSTQCPGGANYGCCHNSTVPPTPTPDPPKPDDPEQKSIATGKRVADAVREVIKKKVVYSWSGGSLTGPSKGRNMTKKPFCNDAGVTGFDCCGMTKYAVYQGAKVKLHGSVNPQFQQAPTKNIPIAEVREGDLVFFGTKPGSFTHVACYLGDGYVGEMPGHYADCSGMPATKTKLSKKKTTYKFAARWW